MPRLQLLLALSGLLLLAACDNVGRAFDPDVEPPDPGGTTVVSNIEPPPNGGDLRDGRPIVRATYPSGGGWPSTVPIVVEFSESMNQASILPTTTNGTDGKIVLRPSSTTTAVPVVYNFLAGGRVLVLRPLANLDAPQQSSYDIVMLPGVRDADGLRFSSSTETILASFTVDPNATADATVMAVYPRDNQSDLPATTEFLCFLTRAVDPATLPNNFFLRTQGATTPLPGVPSLPMTVANVPEARCVGYTLQGGAKFAASTTYELVVNANIRFANDGRLQFNNRTPYSRFTTHGAPEPDSVSVDNVTTGFPDKVNLDNFGALRLKVEAPATAAAGDVVVARIYGSDKSTTASGDLVYVERTLTLPTAGAQPALVDFTGQLGTTSRLKFDDGALTFTAQIHRGSSHSGIVRGSNAAAQDTVRPTIVSLGPPPPVGTSNTDLYAELETLTLFGTASEPIGEAAFRVALPSPVTAGLFASRTGGTFLLAPVEIGRRSTSVGYSLLVRDLAGNLAPSESVGSIVPRGLIAGSLVGNDLVVEAFDSATLSLIVGAEVIVDPGVPTVPASGDRQVRTTDSLGRATFTGLVAASHTITINKTGYDLVTLYNNPASRVSLPLRKTDAAQATAALAATATFPAGSTGSTAIVGSNAFDDAGTLTIRSLSAAPTGLPLTSIQPNRPVILTGFGGSFEPTANPAFSSVHCNILGATLQSPTPPAVPPAADTNLTATIALRDVGSGFGAIIPFGGIDFTASTGLLSGSLSAAPTLRVAASLDGFVGQVAVGVGFPTGANPSLVTANGAFSTAILTGLSVYAPSVYVVTEARDNEEAISRTRASLNPATNTASAAVLPQDLHVLDPNLVGSTVSSPPLLQFSDAIDTSFVETTVPGSLVTGLVGLYDIQLYQVNVQGTGPNETRTRNRGWRVLAEDRNGGVSPTPVLRPYQLPSPGKNPTLANGTWDIFSSARIFRPRTGSAGDFVLGEATRGEVTFTRTQRYSITVQ